MKATDKIQLLERVRTLEGLTDAERDTLLALINEHKTYGLVWEDKSEDVVDRLVTEFPVLTEVRDLAIISDNPDAPNHILIEDDNIDALTTLAYTHEGKIDVIYIDPPYNTGKKDFSYNDSYIDADDSYRHSKWLSFMSRRLSIAQKLLSDRGVIFISIDDHEQAAMQLLCNEIFGVNRYITSIPRVTKLQRSAQEKHMDISHDYILCYAKSEDFDRIVKREYEESKIRTDSNGSYLIGDTKAILADKSKGYSEGGDYDFEYNGIIYSPVDKDGNRNRWLWQKSRMKAAKDLGILVPTKSSLRMQLYLDVKFDEKTNTMVPKNENLVFHSVDLMTSPNFTNTKGSKELKEIGYDLFKNFNNPKPVALIRFLIGLNANKRSIILDFFAGSGTTLHAVMQLNAEDGGMRQCILCQGVEKDEEGNDKHIAENVTYERNKRVIQGYTKTNGDAVEGLHNNNLRYYRTDFISRERTQKNRRELMEKSTDLLCIKEDLYTELPKFGHIGLNPKGARYFANDKKQMLIIYRPEFIPYFVEEIDKMEVSKPIKIYVYAPDRYAYDDEFAIVADKVSLCALPQNIIDAMTRVMPDNVSEKAVSAAAPTIEASEEQNTLFGNLENDKA